MTKALTTTNHKRALNVFTESAAKFAKNSKAKNTMRAYKAAWSEFTAYCEARQVASLPAAVANVVDYLAALAEAGNKVSTIGVKRAAISEAHRLAKHPDPTASEEVKIVMAGISREIGRPPQKKAPIERDDLRALIETLPDSISGLRDKALLLVGWAGAFRRSELVALDVGDLRFNGELKISIRRSKTDQEGEGLVKVIPRLADESLCPVLALRAWLDAAGIQSGAVFRKIDRWHNVMERRLTDQSVMLVVKAAALRAGLDARQFAGHSLRSGFITAAAVAGVDSRDIMSVTGHKSQAVMQGYIQDAGIGAKRAVSAAFGEDED